MYLPIFDLFRRSLRVVAKTIETQLPWIWAIEYAFGLCEAIMQQLQPHLQGLTGRFRQLTLEDGGSILQKIIHMNQINLQNSTVFLLLNYFFHKFDEWLNTENVASGHGFL